MGVRELLGWLLAMMLLAACGSEQVADEGARAATSGSPGYAWEQGCGVTASEHAPYNPQRKNDPSYNADEYVGLSLAEAEERADAAALTVRVLGTDRDCRDRTDDLRPDRVNFYVEDEVVRAAARY